MTARAVVIGINAYPNLKQKPLAGAVDDAIDFAAWAIDPDGGGVHLDDLHLWVHPQPAAMPPGMDRYRTDDRPWPFDPKPDFAAAPTAQPLLLALMAAADGAVAAQNASGGRERLYVFVAGHGAMTKRSGHDKDPQNCLITADFVPNTAFGLIPLDDLRRLLEMRGPAETLLFCDCCRSELAPTVPDPVLNLPRYEDLELNEQWLVGRAAAPGCIAYESPIETPARGAFTKMLVQALRQFRIDDRLTLPELRGFMKYGVRADVAPRVQVPKFDLKDEDDDTPFVIAIGAPIGPLPELRVTFGAGLEGEVRLLGGGPGVAAEQQITDGELALVLAPGQYTLEHEASGREKTFFHTGPGTTNVDF